MQQQNSFLKSSSKKKKKLPKIIWFLLGITIALFGATAIPSYLAYRDAMALKAAFTDFKDGVILQDLDKMQGALSAADKEVKKIQTHTTPLNWTRIIPFVGGYKADMDRVLRASRNSIDAGQLFINAIAPNADLLGFSTENTQAIELSGQQRIQGIVELMPYLADQIDPIAEKVEEIDKDISKINPSRYPKSIGGTNVQEALSQVKQLSDSLAKAAPQFKQILTQLPSELGLNEPKTYLVLFQNDKELRSTGGFWTAYAVITLDKGAVTDMYSGDMYFLDIDNRATYYPLAPAPIVNYLKINEWYIRDVNIYPDFVQSVEKMAEFWGRIPGVPHYDSVVAIDTFVVEDLLEVLGPVQVGGYPEFTSENVTYQLELVSNVLKKNEGDRKDILGGLMREIMNRVFGMPSNEYDKLLTVVFENLSQKHILLYFKDQQSQALAQEFNYSGRINTSWDADYLHINDTNLAGRKANWWMQETVTKTTDKNGKTTLTILYENTGEYNSEWNTGYRDWVRVYVPKGSKLINATGSQNQVLTSDDYGKTFFEAYMAVDPLKSATLTLEYQIPSNIDLKNILIQKQPGTPAFPYTVKWDGKSEDGLLDKDIEVGF